MEKLGRLEPGAAHELLEAVGVVDQLRRLADVGQQVWAAGDEAVEALADAATGEMERLKQFGITARQEGDKVAFTFQGVTTEVERNADAITEYLQRTPKELSGGQRSPRSG